MSSILLQFDRDIASVTLNRPDRGNAIDLPMARELLAVMDAARARRPRALLLQGAGKHFCLGGDIRIPELNDADMHAHVLELTRTLHAALSRLLRLEAPVVLAVSGGVAGAGLGFLGLCDFVVASDSAFFLGAFTAVGLTPDSGVSLTLPRLIGPRRAAEVLLTGRRLDAATALEWGLVNRVTPESELAKEATEVAGQLSDAATGALSATKALMASGLDGFEAHLEREAQSIATRRIATEGKEGVHAHLERRRPRFRAAAHDPVL